MKKMTVALFGAVFAAALLASTARAQASHAPARSSSPPWQSHESMITDDSRLSSATGALTGEITAVLPSKGAVFIRDDRNGKSYEFFLTRETRLRADKGTELAARKNLSLSDFKAGQAVRLKFRLADAEPVELRLRADRR